MDEQNKPKMGRPIKEDARRETLTIRVNEDEKKTVKDAFNKYGTAVMVGIIIGAIAQLNHDQKQENTPAK